MCARSSEVAAGDQAMAESGYNYLRDDALGPYLTNKSGAERSAGDVVIQDASNDSAFTTTTTVRDPKVIGVVAETIAADATGLVQADGVCSVTVDGPTSRGAWLVTSTTAAKATPKTAFYAGSFARALTSTAVAGTVTALLVVGAYPDEVTATGTKGYFAGGTTGAVVATADKITFAADTTAAATTANLSQARTGHAGLGDGSGTKGYFAGGYTGANVATADKVTFSSDSTAAVTTANLSQSRRGGTGLSECSSKGYFAGGYSDAYCAITDKITFSTDTTAAATTANLTQVRQSPGAVTEGSSKGYFAGGKSGDVAPVTTADKVTFSTDATAAATTANLSQARTALAGVSDGSSKGYFAGGDTSGGDVVVVTADKITFSNDTTAAATTANLSQARCWLAGVSGGDSKGYFAGGTTGAVVATADKITFGTDATAAQTSANLSQARSQLAAAGDTGW